MLRRLAPPHFILAAYCGGLCLALAWRPPLWTALLAAAMAALALAGVARAPLAWPSGVAWSAAARFGVIAALLALIFGVAGLAVAEARLTHLSESRLGALTGRTVDLQAVLTALPAVKDAEVTLAVAVESADGARVSEPAHLRLRLEDGQSFTADPTGSLTEGALIAVDSVLVQPLPAAKPGTFDYGRYLRRRGEHALLQGYFADLRVTGHRGGLAGLVDRLRLASRAHLSAGVHPPLSEVLKGMVLGDDQAVDQQSVSDFRRSGLLHILAVSGENVVLLCGMWSFALMLLAVPRLVRTMLLLPVVGTYVVLTGASPSIVRAGVSGVIGLLAILASRPSDGWLLWLAPAAWLLTVNPDNLFDVSFQLSFGAVAGLLVLARPLTRMYRFLPGPLPEQAGVTTAASLSTAPISMLTFGSASLVSVPANLIGGFVLGPIMFLGMLSLLLGFVGTWLSAPLNVVAGLFIGFLLSVAHWFAALPWAVYEWRGVSLRFVLVLAFAGEAAAVAVAARRSGQSLAAFVRDPGRRVGLVAATALLVAATLLLAPPAAAPPGAPTITFLSVGEGAATLVQIPHGPTILVDAGPVPLAAKLRAHGVKRIDLLVLSHGHADHTAGLSDVEGSIPITTALLPRPPQGSALPRIAGELTATGTAVRWCTQTAKVGGQGWSLEAVPSAPPTGESGNQSENDAALVVVAALGGSDVLIPGDCEGDALARLDLPPCAVVELPHHGSRGGFDDAELEALAPRLGVVSVGPNTYGHPTPEMLGLMARHGIPLLRTDQRGDVAVELVGGQLRVLTAKAA